MQATYSDILWHNVATFAITSLHELRFHISHNRRIYRYSAQQSLTAKLAVTEVEVTATVQLTLLTNVEMPISVSSEIIQQRRHCFQTLTKWTLLTDYRRFYIPKSRSLQNRCTSCSMLV